ncbi:MAG TPA: AAA family ATPase [Patescibacteria group bacterium]|nr:AAA family ATPase [Gammaproteobacteria bacterium]HWA51519.1 AAA family ATPase [Patescibacteria group bacterium]
MKLKLYEEGRIIKDDEIFKTIGSNPPWHIINGLFSEYRGFAYKIKPPIEGIRYIPSFIDIDLNIEIPFQELSSGEKYIVFLTLWACNQILNNDSKLLLLDEFDAHLNPSMSKVLIDILFNTLVTKFDIQVIMTTHSPSTIAYVNDNNLFWMQKDEVIRKSSRAEMIPILSDGIITVDNRAADLSLTYQIDFHKGKPIVFVEGITDKIILESAWKSLHGKSMPFHIIDCFDCYFLINMFRRKEIFKNYENQLFIGLMDFDDAYYEWKDRVKYPKSGYTLSAYDSRKGLIYKEDNNMGYMLFLPVPEIRSDYADKDIKASCLSIELLFSNDVIEKYCEKSRFAGGGETLKFKDSCKADFANQSRSFDSEKFCNFQPLFSNIINIIKNEVNYDAMLQETEMF